MFKFFSTLMLAITTFALYAQNDGAITNIKQRAVILDTVNIDNSFSDLMPLKPVLNNRRIVGMGEATHGTHEFQATKFRMFKFLVEQLGYKLFAIEANFTECRKVNDYVMYGKGDARKAIGGTYFWTWKTKEMVQMIEWMRVYNNNKPDTAKVKFYGFDMQFDRGALASIKEKLKKVDSGYYYKNFKMFDTLTICDTSKLGYKKFSVKKADSIKQLLRAIDRYAANKLAALLQFFSPTEAAYLKQDIKVLEQCLDYDIEISNGGGFTFNAHRIRDKSMAENIEWVLNFEGPASKIMIWAHNGHISKTGMGSYLKRAYQAQYYAIGFDFNKGGFRAIDLSNGRYKLSTFTVDDAEPGSSGNVFSQLNIARFFIDIEGLEKTRSAARYYFTTKLRQRGIGAGFNTEQEGLFYLKLPLFDEYDGLIFINETTPTQTM